MKNSTNNTNIFENLLDELKEENLIEETFIQTDEAEKNTAESKNEQVKTETAPVKPSDSDSPESDKTEPGDEIDFYRQRAIEEVAFLQMVESAFAGVERDQMKMVPTFYDDLEVKKVLHTYLQVSPSASAAERSNAEILLLQATEGWYSMLAERDKRMMTAHLRRYCESSRPPLSMPALIALARFYRNSPYSETVRSKFDLMVTRIFSQEDYNSKRDLSFSREELIGYTKELYAEWSSVPLYSTDEDDEGIRQTVAQFEEFISESNSVENFDELINSNFFNRLRIFKESTNEDFYAPAVVAVGIELNVQVGNRYIELLEREKQAEGIEGVESKYGLTNDNAVSETMSKTMTLIEILNQKQIAPKPVEEPKKIVIELKNKSLEIALEAEKAAAQKKKSNLLFVLAGLILTLFIIGIYYGTNSGSSEELTVVPVNLENSTLKNYLKEAQIEDGTLEGVALPTWDGLSSEAKKEALKTMLTFGGEKGYRKIELVNQENKKIAIADGTDIYVVE